jgi:hypothetical protein
MSSVRGRMLRVTAMLSTPGIALRLVLAPCSVTVLAICKAAVHPERRFVLRGGEVRTTLAQAMRGRP